MKKTLIAAAVIIFCFRLCTASQTTEQFKQDMKTDLDKILTKSYQDIAKGIDRKSAPGRGLTYDLWAMCIMHKHTGEQKYLDWAKEGFVYYSRKYRDKDGTIGISSGARNVTSFCFTYDYLKAYDKLSDDDIEAARRLIDASMDKAATHTDWGGHNRAVIEACAAFACARSMPDSPNSSQWYKRAKALSNDAFFHWSIEDASIYQPFWMWYMLTAGEIIGITDELMDAVTTRYYFDYWCKLQMPSGMMPDWGDGDPTHMWEWYMADLIRAGSYYKNGKYIYSAKKIYDFMKANPVVAGNPTVIASAIDWFDTDVDMQPYKIKKSHEAIEELIGKKIVFRNDNDAYMLLNYRDLGNFGHYQRDYLNQALEAFEEKQHHGHADENSIISLVSGNTILLHDGGYREGSLVGWRGDVYHNRLLARNGWPVDFEDGKRDIVEFLESNKVYLPVETQKIHFASFGEIDYSRTRLIDKTGGYTNDRLVLFFTEHEIYIVVDSVLIDVDGPKSFINMWHPSNIISQGSFISDNENYVISWPGKIGIRDTYLQNEHNKDLLIQFLDNRDKITAAKEIRRNFNPSQCFYQWMKGWYYKGMRLNFITVLRPHEAGKFAEDMLTDITIEKDKLQNGATMCINVDMGKGKKAVAGLKLDMNIGLTNLRGRPLMDWKTGTVEYGRLKTDADFAFAIEDDKTIEYGFINASVIGYDGKPLFEMPIQHEMWQGASAGYAVPDLRDRMPVYSDKAAK